MKASEETREQPRKKKKKLKKKSEKPRKQQTRSPSANKYYTSQTAKIQKSKKKVVIGEQSNLSFSWNGRGHKRMILRQAWLQKRRGAHEMQRYWMPKIYYGRSRKGLWCRGNRKEGEKEKNLIGLEIDVETKHLKTCKAVRGKWAACQQRTERFDFKRSLFHRPRTKEIR